MTKISESETIEMAPPSLNDQVVQMAPSVAMASQYLSLAQAQGMMFINGVQAQQVRWSADQAAAVQGIVQIYQSQNIPIQLALLKALG